MSTDGVDVDVVSSSAHPGHYRSVVAHRILFCNIEKIRIGHLDLQSES